MNKKLLTAGASVAIAAIVGYTAMSNATRATPEDSVAVSTPMLDGVQVADASATKAEDAAPKTEEKAAEKPHPTQPYAGTTTESGGFTGDVVEGGADAKVTIIEYASLTCPHCATFHDEIYGALKPDYIESGKVRFIFRDFPLDNFAMAASMIARCGGESRYTKFVHLFMEKQKEWTRSDNVIDELKRLALLGGMNSAKVDACVADEALGQSILDRAREGQDFFNVSSTPTILINGEKFRAVSYEAVKEKIDSLLEE